MVISDIAPLREATQDLVPAISPADERPLGGGVGRAIARTGDPEAPVEGNSRKAPSPISWTILSEGSLRRCTIRRADWHQFRSSSSQAESVRVWRIFTVDRVSAATRPQTELLRDWLVSGGSGKPLNAFQGLPE